MTPLFKDRTDAGNRLTERLLKYKHSRPVILALPRGGVPVGAPVARSLEAPFSVLVVRKLGAPDQSELGMGAIAEGGVVIIDEQIVHAVGATDDQIHEVIKKEQEELARRVRRYRSGAPLPPLAGRTAILVDDGLATGVTARAAIRAVRLHAPEKVILAIPVCAPEIIDILKPLVDEVVCLEIPSSFHAISLFYEQFGQTTDDEVVNIISSLQKASV